MTEPVKVVPMAQLLRLARDKEAREHNEHLRQTSNDSEQDSPTLSNATAQTTQINETAQGRRTTGSIKTAQGDSIGRGSLTALRRTATPRKITDQSKPTAQSNQTAQGVIAPNRDYMKAANSIVRDALRTGLFRGKSKQLYDYLYSKTRGAITPSVSAQITRIEIMKGADLGSTNTLRENLKHLRSVGLLTWTAKAGMQEGNVYHVFIPEEANLPFDLDGNPVQVASPEQSDYSDYSEQKLPRAPSAETAQRAQTLSQDSSTTSEDAKTSFKTKERNTDDDAALAGLIETLKAANKELTGQDLSLTESARWSELADVLVAELKIAAARTTVSSVPSFLAEHLRRRLWKMDKKQARAQGRELPDEHAISAVSTEQAKVKDCPDCGGSGWWYPNGLERGVAKCKHEKLSASKDTTATT